MRTPHGFGIDLITVMASTLYRLMADRIGREYDKAQAKMIFRNLMDVSPTFHHEFVSVGPDRYRWARQF